MSKIAPVVGTALIGIVKRHPDGYGFFIPDDKNHPDVYIPKHEMPGVMTNDSVVVEASPEGHSGNKFRGRIVKVNNRAHKTLIGRFDNFNGIDGLVLDRGNDWGTNLLIPSRYKGNAKSGDLVIVEVLTYPDKQNPFSGRVLEVLGQSDNAMLDTKKIIITHKIPYVFSSDTLKEASTLEPNPTEKDFRGRRDLRQTPLITIDGKTAKDFDDAIFVETSGNGFHLIVAIADVSHYVRVGSAIDRDAYERGTSTYFPNFVVPMLPEILSNELCSLKPNVPRLCMVADMQIDFQGNVTKADFYEAVMQSKARVTYGEAQEVIDKNCPDNLKHVEHVILKATDLAKILMARRFRNGSLDLEIPETQVIVNELGETQDIIRSERIFSNRLIEELMLAANVAVAHFINSKEAPSLYRIHDPPKEGSIELLNNFLIAFGSSQKLEGKALQKKITSVLHEFEGRPEKQILHILTLRSMNQAKYSHDNVGHFGLGFEEYTHFTSPIRRYPDLIVHRVLKNVLNISGYEHPAQKTLESSGTFLSACEQRSVKAERQLISIKKARFMSQFMGQEFDGIISSVTKFGIFVLLRKFDVDGLVKIEDLGDDRFKFDEELLRLVGNRSGFTYQIGQALKVQIASTDPDRGQIDLILSGDKRSRVNRSGESKTRGDNKSGNHKNKHSGSKHSEKRKSSKNNRRSVRKARVSKRSRKG